MSCPASGLGPSGPGRRWGPCVLLLAPHRPSQNRTGGGSWGLGGDGHHSPNPHARLDAPPWRPALHPDLSPLQTVCFLLSPPHPQASLPPQCAPHRGPAPGGSIQGRGVPASRLPSRAASRPPARPDLPAFSPEPHSHQPTRRPPQGPPTFPVSDRDANSYQKRKLRQALWSQDILLPNMWEGQYPRLKESLNRAQEAWG